MPTRKKSATPPPLHSLFNGLGLEDSDDQELRQESSPDDRRLMLPKSPSDSAPFFTCFSLLLRSADCTKPAAVVAEPSPSDAWRSEQLASAHQMDRHLRSRFALDALVESHLARFAAHCHRPIDLLTSPSSLTPPLETAALSWLGGEWRPSDLLAVAPTLLLSSPPLAPAARRALAEAIRRLRVEEAVLDEEMAEYQITAVLTLPFGRRCRRRRQSQAAAVGKEIRKIEGVVEKANRLRYRAVEAVVKGVLEPVQAAEFLVAVAGIQEMVHRRAERWRDRTGPVSIAVQDLEASSPC